MSEERLSQVQRTILEELYHTKVLTGGSASPRHRGLILCAGEKVGKVWPDPFFGQRVDENFKSTFSRSLRNLEDKGLVDLDKGYRRIVAIKITEKGEGALNATCKLRIREEVQAMERRVDRSLGRTQEKPGDSAGGLTGAKL